MKAIGVEGLGLGALLEMGYVEIGVCRSYNEWVRLSLPLHSK